MNKTERERLLLKEMRELKTRLFDEVNNLRKSLGEELLRGDQIVHTFDQEFFGDGGQRVFGFQFEILEKEIAKLYVERDCLLKKEK